ncbi:MAG: TetR/AcrR family transcriptional regulator [Byssovorax sp.]
MTAALALVGEGPLEGVTLREVARRAGVSPSACYHHFPDKDALLAEVAREGFAALADVQAKQRSRSPLRRLEKLATAYVRFALAHRTHYRIMFRAAPGDVTGVGAEVLRQTARTTFDTLVSAIAAVSPEASPDEWVQSALLAWAQAHGAVEVMRWAYELDPSFDPDAFAAQVGRGVVAMVASLGREPT